jgi:hypothetical protein
LFATVTAAGQNFLLFVVTGVVPTDNFGDGAMATQANILFIEAAVPHTWRRNAG